MRLRTVNLTAGLVLAAFVVTHTVNHAFGLWSLQAAESARVWLSLVWRSPPGLVVLSAALVVHLGFAYAAVYRRSHFRLPPLEWIRLALGFAIPLILLRHIILAGVMQSVAGVVDHYDFVVHAMWVVNPTTAWLQALLIVLVWSHLAIGLHIWLHHRDWYAVWAPYMRAAAAVIPALGLAGFARSVATVDALARDPAWVEAVRAKALAGADLGMAAEVSRLPDKVIVGFLAGLALVIAMRGVRRWYRTRHGRVHVTYASGQNAVAPVGVTILETSRMNGIPHASLCGGRGRCSTCRVKVAKGLADLDPPDAEEAKVLASISADQDVRLACQARPRRDVTVVPLLPPNVTAREARRPGGVEGREQQVAILFVDLRGSSKLGESRLPYDVVYILNRFFAELSGALADTNGRYAQFNGDGLMALYGLESGFETGCREAMRGAMAMLRRIDDLNGAIESELNEPLRVGIGIHGGEAIVGMMGPPETPIVSAIGDNVNVAARLEALTKEYGHPVVVSETVAKGAGLDLTGFPRFEAETRGRDATVTVYALPADAGITV